MNNELSTIERQLLDAELKALEVDATWGREHPYAGHCGDDDARADRIADLQAELDRDTYNCIHCGKRDMSLAEFWPHHDEEHSKPATSFLLTEIDRNPDE